MKCFEITSIYNNTNNASIGIGSYISTLVILLFALLSSGQSIDNFLVIEGENKIVEINKFENYFYKFHAEDTLMIYARFSECGEWGGHREIFKIYRDTNNNFISNFIKDTVKCEEDDFIEYKGKIVFSFSKTLTTEDQILIQNYLWNLQKEDLKGNDFPYSNLYIAKSNNLSIAITGYWDEFNELKTRILK